MLSLDSIRIGEALTRLGLALALLAAAALLGYQQGRHVGDAERGAAEAARVRELNKALGAAQAAGDTARAQLDQQLQRMAAERRAWKEKFDATTDADLVATPDCPRAGDPPAADAGGLPRLSGRFLGLYNDAWCGTGDDVPAAACRAAAQAAGAEAVDPRDVLRHTEDEAAACRVDRARYDQLITTLQRPPWRQKADP